MLGVFRLCSNESELQGSHYLPKSLFRVINRSAEPFDEAPTILDARKSTVVASNHQAKHHLLCRECELLFSSRGEDIVVRDCYRGASEGQFRLLKKLKQSKPSMRRNNRSVYFSSDVVSEVNPQAYAYFVLSVLWRGSVASWSNPYHEFKGALGTKYTANVQKYLLDPGKFPAKTNINVYVDFDSPSLTGLSPPVSNTETLAGLRCHRHAFMIPGMRFVVLMGGGTDRIASVNPDPCKVTFFEWNYSTTNFYRHIARAMQRSTPKGKLSKLGKG